MPAVGAGGNRVLALDLASVTGWAVGEPGRTPDASGTWNVAPRRGESPGMRYVRLRSRLNEVRQAFPDIVVVVYEQAHHRGGHAVEYALGCIATVQAWCAEYGLEHAAIHSGTLKKHATGKGNSDKDAMMVAARARGWKPTDDNEADALWLLDYASKEVM